MVETGAPPREEALSWDVGDCYDVAFGVGKSRRYHSAMRDFYQRLSDLITTVNALTGTSAFVALFLEDRGALSAKLLIGLIAIASVLNLVFRFQKKADLHDSLVKRFAKLAVWMERTPATEANRREACAQRLEIEADEPTVRRIIDLRAHNDELRSRGVPLARHLPLGWSHRNLPFGYCFDYGLAGVEERMKSREQAEELSK